MIQKTVYFRDQDDLDKFNAIKNKAEWLHEHLNKTKFYKHNPTLVQTSPTTFDVVDVVRDMPDDPKYEPMD